MRGECDMRGRVVSEIESIMRVVRVCDMRVKYGREREREERIPPVFIFSIQIQVICITSVNIRIGIFQDIIIT
jgi:hypothetical protein